MIDVGISSSSLDSLSCMQLADNEKRRSPEPYQKISARYQNSGLGATSHLDRLACWRLTSSSFDSERKQDRVHFALQPIPIRHHQTPCRKTRRTS